MRTFLRALAAGAFGLAAGAFGWYAASAAATDGAIIERDLAYGGDPLQRLDVYRPPQAENAPILLMVHGGAWTVGDKGSTAVVVNKQAHWGARGWIFVSTNYRMAPDADPLEQAGDVARALAYVQAHAEGWGGDARRVVLMGHSAGAHLVALLAAAPELAAAQNAQPWLATVALDSAALDVVATMQAPHMRFYDRVFGADPEFWRRASPLQRLARAPQPVLLVCSSRRADACAQARAFAARVRALGGQAEVLPQALTHRRINENLGLPGPYTDAVDAFLHRLGLR